jgi:alpha-L-fucosidase 2
MKITSPQPPFEGGILQHEIFIDMMFKSSIPIMIFILLLLPVLSVNAQQGFTDPNLKLWYDRPAAIWEEALPLGNGKTGAMVFGGIVNERFQLNDITLWSGYPIDGNNPEGPEILKKTREDIFKGDYLLAAEDWKKIHGPYCARYLPMGDLFIHMIFKDTTVTNYYRDLNIQNAVSSVKYMADGIQYNREAFISHPDKVMIVNISASRKKSLSFELSLSSKLNYIIDIQPDNSIILKGKAPYHVPHRVNDPVQISYNDYNGEGTNFIIMARIKNSGGTLRAEGNKLVITDADKVTIFLAGATSFNGFDKSPGLEGKDPLGEAKRIIKEAYAKTYEEIKSAHITDFRKLFDRVSLNLGLNEDALRLPTDDRLLGFSKGKTDFQLQSLYYQYGRYLLISSSRDQSNPANLQGLWNDLVQPPWGSNYTTNINLEMNYWLAENTNLPECHDPLLSFIGSLAVNGAKTAKTDFGLEGWCCFHNSDIWAKTSPPGGGEWDRKNAAPRWSAWPMAGAWLCQDLFRHYEYTGDEVFLRDKAWPLMKGAARFLLGWLVEGHDGFLVTAPSSSPENVFKLDGKTYEISQATTMDMAITRDLFNNCIKTINILKADQEFRINLEDALKRLYPYHIGQYGQLQEWFLDLDDPKDNHRHISHLFGLYPGTEISAARTPELASAAKQTLIHRGDISTGWSMVWKINWWSRLGDGDHAYSILKAGLTYIGPKNTAYKGGGTYPNLFDGHPPFQIDGNFGGTAGITEMLLQSYDGAIAMLPAIPGEWQNGEVKGLKAKGNFTVDIKWEKGVLSVASVYSALGGNCRIRTKTPVRVVEVRSSPATGINPNRYYLTSPVPDFKNNCKEPLKYLPGERKIYEIDFMTEKGKTYTIIPG